MDSLMGSNLKLSKSYFGSAYMDACGGETARRENAERHECGKVRPFRDEAEDDDREEILEGSLRSF